MLLKKVIIATLCLIVAIPGMALELQHESVVKLSPQIRVFDTATASMSKQLKALIKPFLKSALVVNTPDLNNYPYVVAFPGKLITAVTGERCYVRGPILATMPSYMIVRSGGAYVDPQTKEILGYALNPIARADVQEIGDPSTFVVADLMLPVAVGDRLIPSTETVMDLSFSPHMATAKISGRIIGIVGAETGFNQAGKYSAVVINQGSRTGIQLGDILTISTPVNTVSDQVDNVKEPVRLPSERIGELVVFKVYERLSFALITNASSNVQVQDLVGNA